MLYDQDSSQAPTPQEETPAKNDPVQKKHRKGIFISVSAAALALVIGLGVKYGGLIREYLDGNEGHVTDPNGQITPSPGDTDNGDTGSNADDESNDGALPPDGIPTDGQTSADNGDQTSEQIPQPGDTKEIGGITYVWTVNDKYGIGMYIDQRLNYISASDMEAYNAYKTDRSLPYVQILPTNQSLISKYGSDPESYVTNFSRDLGCQVQTTDAIPWYVCPPSPDGSDIPYVAFVFKGEDDQLVSIELSGYYNDGFNDVIAAAKALSPRVVPH